MQSTGGLAEERPPIYAFVFCNRGENRPPPAAFLLWLGPDPIDCGRMIFGDSQQIPGKESRSVVVLAGRPFQLRELLKGIEIPAEVLSQIEASLEAEQRQLYNRVAAEREQF